MTTLIYKSYGEGKSTEYFSTLFSTFNFFLSRFIAESLIWFPFTLNITLLFYKIKTIVANKFHKFIYRIGEKLKINLLPLFNFLEKWHWKLSKMHGHSKWFQNIPHNYIIVCTLETPWPYLRGNNFCWHTLFIS